MTDRINIARVTRQQLEQLVNISRKTFTDAFAHLNNPQDMHIFLSTHLTAERLAEELNTAGSEFYFVMDNTGLLAFFKINTGDAQTELKADDGLEIERIYVLKEHQGKKLGRHILHYCISMALQRRKSSIWLGVWQHNTNAIRFYQNNGFTVFDQHRFLLGNDVQTDIMMKLELNDM